MNSYDDKRCRLLLEDYYQGRIAPEEQAELKSLLDSPELPADLEIERSFFAMVDEASLPAPSDSDAIDVMVSDMVAQLAAEEKAARWRKLLRGGSWAAAAAVVAVLIVGATLRFGSFSGDQKQMVAESSQSDLRIEVAPEPQAESVAPEPTEEIMPMAEQLSAPRKQVAKKEAPVAAKAVAPADTITEEQLRMANETLDEVQAFFDSMMADWDNADRGVRGLLKNRGTLADSGEKDPVIVENQ